MSHKWLIKRTYRSPFSDKHWLLGKSYSLLWLFASISGPIMSIRRHTAPEGIKMGAWTPWFYSSFAARSENEPFYSYHKSFEKSFGSFQSQNSFELPQWFKLTHRKVIEPFIRACYNMSLFSYDRPRDSRLRAIRRNIVG